MSFPHLLYASIKKTSKYYGQGTKDEKFPVFVIAEPGKFDPGYVVQGGPGGQYRLSDVDIFAVCTATGDDLAGNLVKITAGAR